MPTSNNAYQTIRDKIQGMKSTYPSLRTKSDDYVFSALCVKAHLYKNPALELNDSDFEEMIVDGQYDGGVDILVTDPNAEASDLIIAQSKFYTSISSDDVINAAQNGSTRVVQSCWLFPSKIHSLIKKETNEAFCRLINKLGITNGYIFFSGFEDHGSLMFFESGFRLCGGHIYEYLSEKGNKSNLDIFIFHALTGSTDGIQCPNKLNLNLKCVTINVYSKSGIINEIAGFDQIREMKDCKFALVSAQIGQICTDDKAILTKVGMFYFCNEDSIKLQQDVENAYKVLRVIGRDNEDLIYDKIDYSVISSWWN